MLVVAMLRVAEVVESFWELRVAFRMSWAPIPCELKQGSTIQCSKPSQYIAYWTSTGALVCFHVAGHLAFSNFHAHQISIA